MGDGEGRTDGDEEREGRKIQGSGFGRAGPLEIPSLKVGAGDGSAKRFIPPLPLTWLTSVL